MSRIQDLRQSVNPIEGDRFWTVFQARTHAAGMQLLREHFSEPDEMNLVLFSTSGIHGSYKTIEDAEQIVKCGAKSWVTFLVVQPRIVSMTYGNAEVATLDDIEFLKKIRQKSWDSALEIGRAK